VRIVLNGFRAGFCLKPATVTRITGEPMRCDKTTVDPKKHAGPFRLLAEQGEGRDRIWIARGEGCRNTVLLIINWGLGPIESWPERAKLFVAIALVPCSL